MVNKQSDARTNPTGYACHWISVTVVLAVKENSSIVRSKDTISIDDFDQ